MAISRTELVIGIDFGTTYSGVSWAINEGLKKVRLINDWPNPRAGGGSANADKVPSVISFKDGRPRTWGYEVTTRDDSFRWIKILLESDHKYAKIMQDVKDSNELLSKVNLSAEEVVAAYLRELWTHTKEHIRRRVEDDDWEATYAVRVVMTVPAMWSHAAKDRTLKAAQAAGLPNPDKIELVTEPEAAALATLKDRAEDNNLKVGDAFVVCDAGGGTVDLISYQIVGLNPMRIKECAIGDGGLCGSAFVDHAFEKYIITLVGERQYAEIKPVRRKLMMENFETGIKRCFAGDSAKDYSVDLRGVEDDEEQGISDDNIPVTINALKTVFDHVCSQIDDLVQNQVAEVQDRDLKVKAILLVGGFGQCTYLHQRLEKFYTSVGIRVLQVEGAWSAISRGACMWGLECCNTDSAGTDSGYSSSASSVKVHNSTVVSRISKYSYGVSASQEWDELRHIPADKYWSKEWEEWQATNQMTWLLRRGDVITEGRVLKIPVSWVVEGIGFWTGNESGQRDFSTGLFYCDLPVPPTRQDENVHALCNVSFTVRESKIYVNTKSYRTGKGGPKKRKCEFEVSVLLGNANLTFSVSYHGEQVVSVEAEYMQKF